MSDPHELLRTLALALGVAGLVTVVFQRLKQPVVLGYLLAGVLVGPHLAIPVYAHEPTVRALSELGVILVMFALGLEFRIMNLVRLASTAGLIALVECSLMFWIGYVAGQGFGWTTRESFYAGGIVAISSTTIIARTFEERGVRGRLREIVFGVLVVEDLIAVLLLTLLTALSAGEGASANDLLRAAGRLVALLVLFVAVGMMLVPRFVRFVVALRRPETTLVASVGICFVAAVLARTAGYSVALGAFVAGSLVAESGQARVIEPLVYPVRDVFSALFFVSVGMLIDPAEVVAHGGAVIAMTSLLLLGKTLTIAFATFLTGSGPHLAIRAGMSMAQIGEFSFIIATLGQTSGATRPFLYPVAVAVSAITTLTTPFLVSASSAFASVVDRTLPKPLQTFVALYGTWVEGIRRARGTTRVRRLMRVLLVDAVVLALVVAIGASQRGALAAWSSARFGLSTSSAELAASVAALAAAVPFAVGVVRLTGKLAVTLGSLALPHPGAGPVDLAAAPRRAFVVTLQLGVVAILGAPLLAMTQPFLSGFAFAALFGVLLVVLGVACFRSVENLHGHVRAGVEVIVEALANRDVAGLAAPADALAPVRELLPGLGEPMSLELGDASYGAGKTLAELDVRGLTGATVLAIVRGEEGVRVPTATERLRARDLLALAGTASALQDARRLLLSGPWQNSSEAPESSPHL